jgi:nucleoside-diphosphate-sugar epimerase
MPRRPKVLVTGADGYIGTQLCAYLLDHDFDVLGIDAGFYRAALLYPLPRQAPQILIRDVRQLSATDLRGFDALVHLAELSNDPLGELNPEVTYKVNHQGSVRLAELCRDAAISRFVYSSSCSVYGAGSDDWKNENSQANPQTAYAECKLLVERDVAAMADDSFSPTFLRNATACGPSPRMRFDIVLNNLCGLAWTTRVIKMTSDGTPWRPLVHVLDICQAIEKTLRADRSAVHNQVMNVGSNEQNYRVRDIARIVAGAFPGCELSFGNSDGDSRSYKVSFDKIRRVLPAFECQYDAADGAAQLRSVFEKVQLSPQSFQDKAFTRLKQLRYLLQTERLTPDLFWTTASHEGDAIRAPNASQ